MQKNHLQFLHNGPSFQYETGYKSLDIEEIPTFSYSVDEFVTQNSSKLDSSEYITNLKDNSFEVIYEWKYLDFEFQTYQQRQLAILNSKYIPENNLPLGIDIATDRIFITTPRWKDGVPASLSYLPKISNELSPLLQPYPNLEEHSDPYNPDCAKLISVYRTQIDECNRLWCIDSGIVNATVNLNQICPPKIVVYNLNSNTKIINYELPAEQVKQESLHSNIIVDIRNGVCNDAYAYVTDVWRYGIVVYSLSKNRSWRTTNYNYYPTPQHSDFNIYGINFQWSDGVFGMSLSPVNEYEDRLLFFHPMASYKEFMVSTAILRDESLWFPGVNNASQSVVLIGNRGKNGQSSTSAISFGQVMFYTLVHRDSVGCWDLRKPYGENNLGIVSQNTSGIMFPNDIKVDKELNQNVWIISNKLPIFLYSKLNENEINFKIMRANIRKSVQGTICDPMVEAFPKLRFDDDNCY